MMRVTVYLQNGTFFQNDVSYAYDDEIAERLNACQPELFIGIADMVVKRGDIQAVVIEPVPGKADKEEPEKEKADE